MQVYKDKLGRFFTETDYASEDSLRELDLINWHCEAEKFQVDAEDFVASVPGLMTLKELEENLCSFSLTSQIQAPKEYSLSRILGENLQENLSKQVLGLFLIDPEQRITKTGAKVIKNVSGYDLSKIFIGSCNSFAVISNIYLRLYKKHKHKQAISFELAQNSKDNFEIITQIKNYLENFFDKSIKFTICKIKNSQRFKATICFTSSEALLDSREQNIKAFLHKTINREINSERSTNQENDLSKVNQRLVFDCNYKTSFDLFTRLTNLLDFDIDYQPMHSCISVQDFKLSKLRETYISLKTNFDFNLRVFPLTHSNSKLLQRIQKPNNDYEIETLKKIKQLYDPRYLLNPGLILDECR